MRFCARRLCGEILSVDQRRACIKRRRAQLFFDPDQLIILGQAVRTGQRAGFDLPAIHRHSQIGNGRILGFT